MQYAQPLQRWKDQGPQAPQLAGFPMHLRAVVHGQHRLKKIQANLLLAGQSLQVLQVQYYAGLLRHQR